VLLNYLSAPNVTIASAVIARYVRMIPSRRLASIIEICSSPRVFSLSLINSTFFLLIQSAAVPGFISPVRLQVKGDDGVVRYQGGEKDQAYWDGSIKQDIPTRGLTEMLNCQVREILKIV